MRIVTWNCQSGESRLRAAKLDSLRPDLVVLQECRKPEHPNDEMCVWFGDRPNKGVAVLTRGKWTIAMGPFDPVASMSVFPVIISGPVDFNMLAVCSERKPSYVRAILDGLDAYRAFLTSAPSVVAGDFNSNPCFDSKGTTASHMALTTRLQREFGLVNASRLAATRSGRQNEEPTFYMNRKENSPFHIDYCFIPASWSDRMGEVSVGGYSEWTDSDHRPLLVEVAVENT